MDFNKLKILEGEYWDVFLHEDQTAIGRLYFWFKGDEEDLLDISKEALIEFYDLGKKVKAAITKTLSPDIFNYLALNNKTSHLHIHLIPRYSRKIKMFGTEFSDNSFGAAYKRNHDLKIDEEVLIKIKDLIKNNIS